MGVGGVVSLRGGGETGVGVKDLGSVDDGSSSTIATSFKLAG